MLELFRTTLSLPPSVPLADASPVVEVAVLGVKGGASSPGSNPSTTSDLFGLSLSFVIGDPDPEAFALLVLPSVSSLNFPPFLFVALPSSEGLDDRCTEGALPLSLTLPEETAVLLPWRFGFAPRLGGSFGGC